MSRKRTDMSAEPVYLQGESAASVDRTFTVDTTAGGVALLAANPARKGFLLVNNGATNVYIGFSSGVVSGAAAQARGGALLGANGGILSGSQVDGWLGALYGITAAGSSVVAVKEW